MNKPIILSILIPTIPSREARFMALWTKLKRQVDLCYKIHPTLGACEIVFNNGVEYRLGGLSIGSKRQVLLDQAKGIYLCFLDDDEDISPDYVETLLRLCYEQKDVGTFRSLSKLANNWALIDMSLQNPNEQINPLGITRRSPWHICPVKSEYAKSFRFPDSNYGEDFEWFAKVLTLCMTESHTDKIIHVYNHGIHSEADKIK